jgi:hypothetical protein
MLHGAMLHRSRPLLLVLLLSAAGLAADLPSGAGLAAKYPGDRGIEKDPAVVFAEDFEPVADVAALSKRWTEISNKANRIVSLAADSPPDAGKRCVQLTALVTENTGGHLYKKLPRELETIHARFYVKFPREAGYIHHFVHMGGYRPATNWPQGGAGDRPRGDERMTVGIEPFGSNGRLDPPGAWNFYAYWHEMKISARNRYWGNSMAPAKPLIVPRDRWQCVEVMMKLNTPGKRDGELALWLDGDVAMHIKQGTPRDNWTGMGFRITEGGEPFEGFSWRTSGDLKINFFWLLHYVTDTALKRNGVTDLNKPVTVWFDNIVVSEKYVGPIGK